MSADPRPGTCLKCGTVFMLNKKHVCRDERDGLPSASKVELYMNCPGSLRIIKDAPPEKPNPFAESGVRVHDYLAGDADIALTDDELTVAESCQRLEREFLFKVSEAARAVREDGSRPIVRTFSERRMFLHESNGVPLMSARLDKLVHVAPFIIIQDYKTGRLPATPAPLNWQLKSEVVIADEYFDFREAHVAILQPWVSPQISSAVITAEEVPYIRSILKDGLKRTEHPNAPLFPGDHCRFCPGRLVCPEANKTTLTPLDWRDSSLSGNELSRRLSFFPVVESVIEEHRALAREFLSALPDSVPGWELEAGNEIEVIDNIAQAFAVLKSEGITAEEFLACCRVSVDALRNLYARKTKCTYDQAKETLPAILGGAMKRKQNEPSLKRKNTYGRK